MDASERIEELRNARGSIYRVRMQSSYAAVGRDGASEIALAEALVERAIKRARGERVGPLPKILREIRAELQEANNG